MNILEKIKILSWIWRLPSKMTKLQAMLGKFDGLKSLLGLLGVVGYYGAQAYGLNPPDPILKVSYGLLGVGMVHKLDKATDIIAKALPALSKILDAFNKKKEEEKK